MCNRYLLQVIAILLRAFYGWIVAIYGRICSEFTLKNGQENLSCNKKTIFGNNKNLTTNKYCGTIKTGF